VTDARTLQVYADRAQDYAEGFAFQAGDHVKLFETTLPRQATILDLGCGPGKAAAYFADHGHLAHAWDPVQEMVVLAAQHPGVTARQAGFEDLATAPALDGLWASFSLLHAPRATFPRYLAAATERVKPGGLVFLGMKTGEGEGPDSIGRHYAYYSVSELDAALRSCEVEPYWHRTGEEVGLSGEVAPYVLILGRKDA